MECRKKKANEWRLRLIQELKHDPKAHFVTLTISTENVQALTTTVQEKESIWGYSLDNELAKLSVKRFRERWRKHHRKSPKHWLITELGQTATEHLHLHGFIWTAHPERIEQQWQYGFVFLGKYVGERSANYCVKYFLKSDNKHQSYKPIILASPGIGKHFAESVDAELAKYTGPESTREYAVTRTGHKIYLPKYYRNKLYTEEQREKLWIAKLNSTNVWVGGRRISTAEGHSDYLQALGAAQAKNRRLGYGPTRQDEETDNLENTKREQQQKKRLANIKTTQ